MNMVKDIRRQKEREGVPLARNIVRSDSESTITENAYIDGQIRGRRYISWYRYHGNPVIEYGTAGNWDGNRITDPKPIIKDEDIWVYCNGASNAGNPADREWEIGLKKSTDGGESFNESGVTNPIITPTETAGDWNEISVADPAVHYDGKRVVMVVLGRDSSDDRKLGVYTSTDGESFSEISGNPTLDISDGGTFDTSLTKKDSTYHFYIHNSGGFDHYTFPKSDLEAWADKGKVLDATEPWENGNLRAPGVARIDDEFVMLYNDNSAEAIGYAYSDDGQNWTKYEGNPIQQAAGDQTWETGVCQDPNPVEWNGKGRLFYDDSAGEKSRIGMMKEDVHNFHRPTQPDFGQGDFIVAPVTSGASIGTSWGKMDMNSPDNDRHAQFSGSSNEFNPGAGGVYLCHASVRFGVATADDTVGLRIVRDGNIVGDPERKTFETANIQSVEITRMVLARSGQNIWLEAINENSSDSADGGSMEIAAIQLPFRR